MRAPITTMTSAEIKARLTELEQTEKELSAIDYDGELSAVLMAGGDVDALEARQLESERLSRRLRVERQALNAALPEAVKAETRTVIADTVQKHDKLASEAATTAQLVVKRWRELEKAVDNWMTQRIESVTLTREAAEAAAVAGLPTPELGAFVDSRLLAAAVAMQQAGKRLAPASEHGVTIGKLHQIRELTY